MYVIVLSELRKPRFYAIKISWDKAKYLRIINKSELKHSYLEIQHEIPI